MFLCRAWPKLLKPFIGPKIVKLKTFLMRVQYIEMKFVELGKYYCIYQFSQSPCPNILVFYGCAPCYLLFLQNKLSLRKDNMSNLMSLGLHIYFVICPYAWWWPNTLPNMRVKMTRVWVWVPWSIFWGQLRELSFSRWNLYL